MKKYNLKYIFNIGDIIEELTILDNGTYIKYDNRKERGYNCKCSCGNNVLISVLRLTNKKFIKACKDCASKIKISRKYKYQIANGLYNIIKSRANERQIKFKINQKDLDNLMIKQNKKCALSGIELTFPKTNKEITKTNCSLDRIDSTKGYICGNIQWVHKDINYMKMNLDELKFIDYCCKIASYKGN